MGSQEEVEEGDMVIVECEKADDGTHSGFSDVSITGP